MLSENLNLRLGEADDHPAALPASFSLSFTPFQGACGKMEQPPGSLCVTQPSSAPWDGAVTLEVAELGLD